MATSKPPQDRSAAPVDHRALRLLALRREGEQLLNLYLSLKDCAVRAAILELVKSTSAICGETAPRVAALEREAEETHRAACVEAD